MTRPLVVDAFCFNNELDLLEMRLTELFDVVDYFVLVESPRDHQDHPKPLHYQGNKDRYAAWADKIVHVVTDDMPTREQDNDPWAREHAQREGIGAGLAQIEGVGNDTLVMQSDVDEVPHPFNVNSLRIARPIGLWSFAQRGHFFAIDWLYDAPWFGTVVGPVSAIRKFHRTPFAYMRDNRLHCANPLHLRDAGWHFSWLGEPDDHMRKVGSFCHPEILQKAPVSGVEHDVETALSIGEFKRLGIHVDGRKMFPIDVNPEERRANGTFTWPQFIREGKAPQSWYRPR